MKIFSSPSAKRQTAVMVLLVWLFALASGVANACLLETRGTHPHVTESSETMATPGVMAGHAGAVADDGDDLFTTKAPCLKACNESAQALAKPDLNITQADTGPALLVAIVWAAATPVVVAPQRMGHTRPDTPEPPIRVRYSRLAL